VLTIVNVPTERRFQGRSGYRRNVHNCGQTDQRAAGAALPTTKARRHAKPRPRPCRFSRTKPRRGGRQGWPSGGLINRLAQICAHRRLASTESPERPARTRQPPSGAIIDGRHRYRACETLGIEPKVQEWDGEGSLTSFVVGLNLHRRHLDTSQRAAVAAEALPFFEGEAQARRKAGQDKGRQARWSPANLPETIDASCVVGDLLPIGNKPANEAQARPLASLPKEERSEAWGEALERSNGKPTAKVVEQVVRERKPKPEPALADERPKMMSHGTLVNGQPAADPPDVAKARKAGLIPADAKVEIDEPDDINVETRKVTHG
jgi:hypothetical protein